MTDGALLLVKLFTIGVAQRFRAFRGREATAVNGLVRIHLDTLGQPLVIGCQGQHVVTAILRWLAIHGIGETAGDALFQVVDVAVLAPEVGQGDRGGPHRSTERHAAFAQVAAGAVHIVEHVLAAKLLGIGKQVIATADDALELRVHVGRFQVLHGGRDVHQLILFGGGIPQLRQGVQVVLGALVGGHSPGKQERAGQYCDGKRRFHGFISSQLDCGGWVDSQAATARMSSSLMRRAIVPIRSCGSFLRVPACQALSWASI